MLEQLAKENAKKVRIVKVNANQNREWAQEENISGVPTVQFYRKGEKVHQFSGAYPKDIIQQQIDLHSASWGKETDEDGNPIVPAIQPMPKEWMPPGVTPE